MTTAEMQRFAVRFLPRVHRIARGVCRQLPSHIAAEDLAHAGVLGMLTALRSFDERRTDRADVYVARRVRGAILDELRALDPLSRDQRRDARTLAAATRGLETELGRAPDDDEIAGRAGLAVERLREVRERAAAAAPLPLDALPLEREGVTCDPVERIAIEEQRGALTAAISALPARQKIVLSLYYVEELSLKEIGQVLGVSESRVCQLHGMAVKALRARLLPA
jgi:RNA polymerase sigma factor for flagellar operon FliA